MFKNNITKRAFISLFLTIFLVEVTMQATSFLQGIFIGTYLDTNEFSAYGLAVNYVNFQYIIGSMFATGTQITVVAFLSKGEKKKAQSAFFISIITVIALSLLIILMVNIFADEISIFFGARGNAAQLLPQVKEYLLLIVLGTPAYCLSYVLPQVALLQGGQKYVYSSYVAMLLLTLAGCVLNFEILEGGLFGLGIMYSVNYYIIILVLSIHFLNKNNTFNFFPKRLKFTLLKPIFKQAMPDMTMGICLLIFPIVSNALILSFDQAVDGLAAFSMQMNFRNFIATLSTGICNSAMVLFGMYSSQFDFQECRKTMNYSILLFLCTIIPISLLIAIFTPGIVSLYTHNESTIPLATIGIFWLALYLPGFFGFRFTVRILQSIKHNVSAVIQNVLGYLIIPIITDIVMAKAFGIAGLLIALPVAQIIQCLICAISLVIDHLYHKNKNNNITFWQCIKTKDYPVLDVKTDELSNTEKIYKKIENFCKSNNINDYTIKRIFLVFEESMYISKCYQKNRMEKHPPEAKIIIHENLVVLRIRDSFPKFISRSVIEEIAGIDVYNIDENYRRYLSLNLIWSFAYGYEHEYIINFNNFVHTFRNIEQNHPKDPNDKFDIKRIM